MFLSPIISNASVNLSVQACLPSCSRYIISPAELEDHRARVMKPRSTNPLHHDHTYFNESQPKTKQKTPAISKKQQKPLVISEKPQKTPTVSEKLEKIPAVSGKLQKTPAVNENQKKTPAVSRKQPVSSQLEVVTLQQTPSASRLWKNNGRHRFSPWS